MSAPENSALPTGTSGHHLQAFQRSDSGTETVRTNPSGDGRRNSDVLGDNGAQDGSLLRKDKRKATEVEDSDERGQTLDDDVEREIGGADGSDEHSEDGDDPVFSENKSAFRNMLTEMQSTQREKLLAWIDGKLQAREANTGSQGVEVRKRADGHAPSPSAPVVSRTQSATLQPTSLSQTRPTMTLAEGNFFSLTVEAPEPLIALMVNRHYLPLTMCTTDAVKDITINKAGKVKYAKQYDRFGTKHDLIDASTWGDELSMTKEEWRDAYHNFDIILREATSNPDIQALFKSHFDFLCTTEVFRNNFPAALRFDIEVRQKFLLNNHTKFAVGSWEYSQRLMQIAVDVVCSDTLRNNTKRPVDTQLPTSSDSFRSFRNGNLRENSYCLICDGRDHIASTCSKQTLKNGKAIFSAWRDNRLVSALGRKSILVSDAIPIPTCYLLHMTLAKC
ncbi:hypothetical protein BDY19DRAFT_908833 [Irpex rosettiformis]|uniref:Uncharacterized protein n=1 Tax=Irpex rosettiformis TaxID=378272 RepID=A0ACB8TV16_9APHY|nr:hypothetical protein BDY19DRAFT_908833 [Irpex rosettiformis]